MYIEVKNLQFTKNNEVAKYDLKFSITQFWVDTFQATY